MRPVSGNTGTATPRSSTSASAQTKSGTARNRPVMPSIAVSPRRRRLSVPRIASAPPSSRASARADTASSSVAGSRPPIRSSTLRLNVIDVPKSPPTSALQPDAELQQHRPIEAVARPQRHDVRGTRPGRDHHGDGIARRHPQQDEDHDGHAEQRHDHHGDPMEGGRGDHRASLRPAVEPANCLPDGTSAGRCRRTPRTSPCADGALQAVATSVGCRAPETLGVILSEDL